MSCSGKEQWPLSFWVEVTLDISWSAINMWFCIYKYTCNICCTCILMLNIQSSWSAVNMWRCTCTYTCDSCCIYVNSCEYARYITIISCPRCDSQLIHGFCTRQHNNTYTQTLSLYLTNTRTHISGAQDVDASCSLPIPMHRATVSWRAQSPVSRCSKHAWRRTEQGKAPKKQYQYMILTAGR